jgi:hypothetical protein
MVDDDIVAGEIVGLLAHARHAGPAHRIEWRDRIAAYGQPAIKAIVPWLDEPKLAAFAVRVIERAGQRGEPEREVAVQALRSARRAIDPCVRPDLEWVLLHLREASPPRKAAIARNVPPARVVRAERPRGVGRAIRIPH